MRIILNKHDGIGIGATYLESASLSSLCVCTKFAKSYKTSKNYNKKKIWTKLYIKNQLIVGYNINLNILYKKVLITIWK